MLIKPFRNTILRRRVGRLQGIIFLKLIKLIKLLHIYTQNGVVRTKSK